MKFALELLMVSLLQAYLISELVEIVRRSNDRHQGRSAGGRR